MFMHLADSTKGLFGAKKQQDNAVEKMGHLKVCQYPIDSAIFYC